MTPGQIDRWAKQHELYNQIIFCSTSRASNDETFVINKSLNFSSICNFVGLFYLSFSKNIKQSKSLKYHICIQSVRTFEEPSVFE